MKFKRATDFRKSLEGRLQVIASKTGEDLQRIRRKVAFDRLLARIFFDAKPPFFLKGGYAMELRLATARATRDIDLTCMHRATQAQATTNFLILDDLRRLAMHDLGDFFTYQIGEAQIDLDNAPYGGARYPVTSLIDGRVFVRFQLDVGADALTAQTETLKGHDWLEFCSIAPPLLPTISIEQQFAEKLHAYTLPRERPNTRVKDLIDMVLLMHLRPLDMMTLREAVYRVFKTRHTHALPQEVTAPPENWQRPYEALAIECALTLSLQEAHSEVCNLYFTVRPKAGELST